MGLGEDKKREILEKAYEQAMDRITSQMPGLQVLGKKTLAWITCAKRKLTTSELQHALAVEIGSTELDQDNLPDVEDMVSACAGLVTVDKESDIIRLVHYTTQEYFERTQQDWFPDAEADITEICVTYLSFSVFESGNCLGRYEFEARLRSNPLYNYTAHHWGHHARAAPDKQLILDFLESGAKAPTSSQVILAYEDSWRAPSKSSGTMTCVHLAAYFGLMCITSLLENGHGADDRDGGSRTPLWWAVNNGHATIVKLLLEKGADVNAKDRLDQTSLILAAKKGHEAIVQLLLNKGADIEAKDKYDCSQTSLLLAADKRHEAVVQLLLEKGADIEAKDKPFGRTSLVMAAEKGHEVIVQLLLNKGADIETKNAAGQTPLSFAAQKGDEAIVRLLLENGADVKAKDAAGKTPLSFALEGKHEAIVRLLLDKAGGTSVKVICNTQTLIERAAEKRREALVRLLQRKS